MGGSKQNYFFEVKYLWQWLNDCDQDIDSWLEKVKTEINEENANDSVLNERVVEFGNALKELQNQWLALIKIPEDKIKNDRELEDPSHDYLTMLFDRISSNGTRLSPDDLLFSMVKQSWPEAHNIVYKIHEKVGSLMKPTDFVMTAYRLALLNEDIADEAQPNARSFHKNLGKLLGTEKQPGILKELISESNKSSPLVKAFENMKSILEYRGEGDNGIPEAMFPYLDVPLQQVILFWLLNREFQANDRNNIISFMLYWMLCNKGAASKYEASKKSIEILSKANNQFPILHLYKTLSIGNAGNKPPLFCPLIHSSFSYELNTSFYRKPNERAEHFFGKDGIELYLNFSKRKELLIWFQRNWINVKFKDFDPLAGQDEDNVPYDFDHFIPQSNWSSFQGVGLPRLESTIEFNNLWCRRSLGDSIGNYRILSAPDNRSRNDTSLEQELIVNESKNQDSSESNNKNNEQNAIDYRNNYAFDPNGYELEQWKIASPKETPYDWNDKRVLAFQYAIESRIQYLYKRYYDEAKFNLWLPDSIVI